MGYWFSGFFIPLRERDERQRLLPALAAAARRQWPYIVCRKVREPFVGLGARMTWFPQDGADEEVEKLLAFEDELLTWSLGFPALTCLYLEADCFGGACSYGGLVCRGGVALVKEAARVDDGPLLRLLGAIDVEMGSAYFAPLARGFFGPEKYFSPGERQDDLERFLSQQGWDAAS